MPAGHAAWERFGWGPAPPKRCGPQTKPPSEAWAPDGGKLTGYAGQLERKSACAYSAVRLFSTALTQLDAYSAARFSKISTAGNFLPSKNSKKAPPPVEM